MCKKITSFERAKGFGFKTVWKFVLTQITENAVLHWDALVDWDARAHTEETARTAGGQVRVRKQPVPMGLRHPHQLLDESRNSKGYHMFHQMLLC